MNEQPTDPPARRRLRWWQFGLRSLLLVTLGAALVAKVLSRPERLEEAAPQGTHRFVREVIRDREGKPFNHGAWTMYDASGATLVEGQFRNGLPHGKWTYWHVTEAPAAEAAAREPVRRRSMEGRCERGQPIGTWTAWYPSGQKHWQIDYLAGAPSGPARHWGPDGQMIDSETSPARPGSRHASGRLSGAEVAAQTAWEQALAGDDPLRRSQAAWALGQLDAATDEALLKIIGPTDDAAGPLSTGRRTAARRAAAIETAGSRSNAIKFLPQFRRALDDESRAVRLAALDALARLGPSAAPALAKLDELLRHAVSAERGHVLAAVASIDQERNDALQELVGRYIPHVPPESEDRDYWADALNDAIPRLWLGGSEPGGASANEGRSRYPDGDIHRPAALPRLTRGLEPGLIGLLKNKDVILRAKAALALGWLEGPPGTAVPELIALLDDAEPTVPYHACHTLRKFGPAATEAVPALKRLAASSNAELAQAAKESLSAIERQEMAPAAVWSSTQPGGAPVPRPLAAPASGGFGGQLGGFNGFGGFGSGGPGFF